MAVTNVLYVTSSGDLGLRNISYEAVEEVHELSGGRPSIPAAFWKTVKRTRTSDP